MADFNSAFDRAILAEGGYKLHEVAGDRGGQTYAGIARNKNPRWPGWAYIDAGATPPVSLVRDFYREGWWDPIQGDAITDERVAYTLYSFATNSSAYGQPKTAVKLAQIVVGTAPDGVLGSKTLAALNAMDPELFVAKYALARIARYAEIVNRDRSQLKFLLGWTLRSLREAS